MRRMLMAVLSLITCLVVPSVKHSSNETINLLPSAKAATSEPSFMADGFDVEVLIGGVPLDEYVARGRHYVEALEGAEYELRVRNPTGERVAVALSVDGLNTIDARRTSAWNASKWVIGPYQSIYVRGWQMSGERARRFYFTTERDSYGAKLGQTANLGLINAVFFRERSPVAIIPPPRRRVESENSDETVRSGRSPSERPKSSAGESRAAKDSPAMIYPTPDDDYAATGIGRNVLSDVTWVNMELNPQPIADISLRYEFRPALIRLGVIPRPYTRPDTLNRRERARGFEPRAYCPEP